MARVSLIVLQGVGIAWPSERLAACRAGLEELGHDVEVLAVSDPSDRPASEAPEPWSESLVGEGPGLSKAAVTGIRASSGDLLVILDLAMAYTPEDVFAVADHLARDQSDLVVAARPRRILGSLSRRVLGISDPSSGLLGLTRQAAIEADDSFAPVGSRFSLELVARVGGRRADLLVGSMPSARRTSTYLDDVRMAKRLADDRFGNASRLIQFCVVGASGMVVDLTCYAALQMLLSRTSLATTVAPVVGGSLALATSAVLAVATALTWNFSINRRLTFNDSRGGSILAQYVRYVLSNLLGIAVSLTIRLALPRWVGFFEQHRLVAAVVGIVTATGISFTMARWFVFGQRPAQGTGKPSPPVRRRCPGLRGERHDRLRSVEQEAQPASSGANPC